MWFKKSSQVLTLLTALVLFVVATVLAPVVPKPANHPALRADAPSLLAEANRLSWLDNWSAAEPLYERAESLFRASGDRRDEVYARVGRIYAQGESHSWEEVSLALQQQVNDPITSIDDRLRLWCLAVKGRTDLDLDTESSERDWAEALEIANRLGEKQWASRAQGELGVIAFLHGNPTLAVSLIGQALIALHASEDAAGESRLLSMLGNGYNEVHRYAEARWFFRRAISILENTSDAGFPYTGYEGDAHALAGEGKQSEAVQVLAKVLSRATRENRYGFEADALLSLGEIALDVQDVDGAKSHLERAAEISRSRKFYPILSAAMIELAGIYRKEGQLKTAEASLQEGLRASRRVGARYYLPRDLTAAAELKMAEHKLKDADELFEQAENVIDQTLAHQHTDYGKAALSGSMSQTYLEHFHLLQPGNVGRAFRLIERIRGRTTASRIYEPNENPANSPALAALQADIANVQLALLAATDPKVRLSLQDKLVQDERHLAFEDNEVSRTRWSLLGPASLRSVQRVLRKDELLLEYVLDDPNAFCITITAATSRILVLPSSGKHIQDLAESYLRELKAREANGNVANELYSILLSEPLQGFHKSRVIIVPDGVLHFLPFEALRDRDGTFVVASRVVSYTPSATALWVLRTAKTEPATRPLLAIGDVEYADRRISQESHPSQRWVPGVFRDLAELSSSHLQNLPESRQEVLSIAQIAGAGSKVLLGRDATETVLKALPISQYRVVHLAVHAIADSQYPDRSALVFAADNPPEDGLLQVREITRLHLNADLVTLSACQTGVGATEGEAGVISLEQAFLMAGAKAVVASLWNVEDQSTTVLMESFYRHLAEHEDKALALAHAKRDFLEQNRNLPPYYWAGFVIVGEGAVTVSFGN